MLVSCAFRPFKDSDTSEPTLCSHHAILGSTHGLSILQALSASRTCPEVPVCTDIQIKEQHLINECSCKGLPGVHSWPEEIGTTCRMPRLQRL